MPTKSDGVAGCREALQGHYATVQNKLHWAIHGLTAAEIVQS